MRSNAARSALLVAGLGLMGVVPAQSQEELVSKRDAKLASAWLKDNAWITDYDKARAAAKESGKLIFAYFTRSYAFCPPCDQLEKTVLTKPEFAEFLEQVVPFCHITSRVEGEPYAELLQEKGGGGFPYLVILDAAGDVLSVQDNRTLFEAERPTAMLAELLNVAKDTVKLREKAASGDPAARIELFQKRLEFASSYEKAQSELADLKKLPEFGKLVDASKLASIEQYLANLEFQSVLASIKEEPTTPEARAALIKSLSDKAVEMRKVGHIPNQEMAIQFWGVQIERAQDQKDLELFDEVAAEWKKHLDASQPMDQQILQVLDRRREALEQEVDKPKGDGATSKPTDRD